MMEDYEGTDRVRQVDWLRQLASDTVSWAQTTLAEWLELGGDREGYIAVSYTHLTLPTSDLV